MVKEQCDGCRFWMEKSEEPDDVTGGAMGLCRRNPPVRAAYHDQSVVTSEWENWSHPFTLEDDWCGEFQPASKSTT